MSAFEPATFVEKLSKLNVTQLSVESISQWALWHRKHHKICCDTWLTELRKAEPKRKLAFLYLANDIVQNSRKKGPEFTESFARVLPVALQHVTKHGDESMVKAVTKMVGVWEERRVFGSGKSIKDIKDAVQNGRASRGGKGAPPSPGAKLPLASKIGSAFSKVEAAQRDAAQGAPAVPDDTALGLLISGASPNRELHSAALVAVGAQAGRLLAVAESRENLVLLLREAIATQEGLLSVERARANEAQLKYSQLQSSAPPPPVAAPAGAPAAQQHQQQQSAAGTANGAAPGPSGGGGGAADDDDADAYDPAKALWDECMSPDSQVMQAPSTGAPAGAGAGAGAGAAAGAGGAIGGVFQGGDVGALLGQFLTHPLSGGGVGGGGVGGVYQGDLMGAGGFLLMGGGGGGGDAGVEALMQQQQHHPLMGFDGRAAGAGPGDDSFLF